MKNNNTHGESGITKRTSVYHGKVIDLGVETVTLPNGQECSLEIIRHPGGAVALAINAKHEVCLLRQYRHATGGWIWELPGGRIEADETPLLSAQRELREEAGIEAGHWSALIEMWSTPGFCTEKLYLYVARDLIEVQATPEADELFEVHWLPLTEAFRMCDSGDIEDAKTLIGLFRLRQESAVSGTNNV